MSVLLLFVEEMAKLVIGDIDKIKMRNEVLILSSAGQSRKKGRDRHCVGIYRLGRCMV